MNKKLNKIINDIMDSNELIMYCAIRDQLFVVNSYESASRIYQDELVFGISCIIYLGIL
jgi:hypothetical protein